MKARLGGSTLLPALALMLLGTLCLGLFHLSILPPFEGFDETGHYSYIQQMALTGTWPSHGDPMWADIDAYVAVAPVPPAVADRWNYPAFFDASDEVRAAGAHAVHGPPADGGLWHPGAIVNWEAQHPPLYYALLGPVYRLVAGQSLGARLFVLRAVSYGFAWLGLGLAVLAASSGASGEGRTRIGRLAPAFWPLFFPMWFPEMARLGNDSLVALVAGLSLLVLNRIWIDGAKPSRLVLLGLCLGLGLLTKATVLPLGVAVLGMLLVLPSSRGLPWQGHRVKASSPALRDYQIHTSAMMGVSDLLPLGEKVPEERMRGLGAAPSPLIRRSQPPSPRRREGPSPIPSTRCVNSVAHDMGAERLTRRATRWPCLPRLARLRPAGIVVLLMVAFAGWWYLRQAVATGTLIGSNDAQTSGVWESFRTHMSLRTALRILADYAQSFVYAGTWSFAVPQRRCTWLLIAGWLGLAAAASRRISKHRWTSAEALAGMTLVLFLAGLTYQSIFLVAINGGGAPAWYLHSLVAVLWPLPALVLAKAATSRISRRVVIALAVASFAYLIVAILIDITTYAGCTSTPPGAYGIGIATVAACLTEPGRLVANLRLLAFPDAGGWFLAIGLASLAAGAALGLDRHQWSDPDPRARPASGRPEA